MDQEGNNNVNEQPQVMEPSGSDPIPYGIPYGIPQYLLNQMMVPATLSSVGPVHSPQIMGPPSSSAQLTPQQEAYQQQHQLHQILQDFWSKQMQEVENVADFKNNNLPLARIKKIMKADEDVRMISAEAPIIFARACEMFILELTLRAWNHTEENKRKTLQKNDISAAIKRTDIFDFLLDIVPREDMSENVLATPIPRGPFIPTEGYPFYYMPQQPMGLPGMIVRQPVDHGLFMQQQQQYIAHQQQILQQLEEDDDDQEQEEHEVQEVVQELEQELEQDLEQEQEEQELHQELEQELEQESSEEDS